MATIAAQITDAGIVSPSYADILAELRYAFWSIYGSDADLDADTQDGQLLAVFAQAIYDSNQVAVAVYNAFSPATAQGAGLSSVVKINGLQRHIPTNSQATVRIVGQAFTPILNGAVGDTISPSNQWALPASVTIPEGGQIDVLATCQTVGAVSAAPDTLTRILTPTRGWQTVTNPAAATLGSPVEDDADLRRRQASSTALPAETPLDSIYSTLANVPGVARAAIFENDTDATDGNGIPSHSISAVVRGGTTAEIAAAIALKKAPGTGTYGTTEEIVFDQAGVPNLIRFYELEDVILTVQVTIRALTGYVSTTGEAIKASIAAYLSGLSIGEDSYYTRLFAPATLNDSALGQTYVVTVLLQCREGGSPATADVDLAFYEAVICTADNIELSVI